LASILGQKFSKIVALGPKCRLFLVKNCQNAEGGAPKAMLAAFWLCVLF